MSEQSIAHYRILEKIGQGGMGEVYRASDTKLHRDVAIKVLPEVFASDPDRMVRFSREAQVLASLNHPNIAAIHGLEESEGRRALVMELVEGETLAERLGRGPVPLEEALGIARQIAEALEEAHERGIIHRDLKPANVKVTPAGTVKLLDFGLAKALEGEPGSAVVQDFSQSPTLAGIGTQAGMILGTAAYMSPEQARGQKADRRSDIWSFGVVLYELLTAKQAFAGETVSDVLASVLKADPEWSALPSALPAATGELVRRCLVRDPKQRLQSIGDARIALAESLARPGGPGATVRLTAQPAASRGRRLLPWALFAATLAALLAALGLRALRPASSEPPLRLEMAVSNRAFDLSLGSNVVLSPDGSRLAYVVGDDNARSLYVRSLERSDTVQLTAGSGATTSPYHPFFSPDGAWVGFVTPSELRKIPATGGTAQTLCKLERSRGASWSEDGTIVLAPSPSSGLVRVSAAGGDPKPLTTLDRSKGEVTHRWPQVLPGGKAVLFTSHKKSRDFNEASIEVVMVATGERKVVLSGGSYGRYVPSGHLVYINQTTLFAVPFDLTRLAVTSSPVPIVENVATSTPEGGGQFSFSRTGRLAYVTAESIVSEYPVVWVNRKGETTSLLAERGSYGNPRLSPDGRRLALTVLRDGNWDVWVYDLERGVPTRLTFDDAAETEQVWSPDGRELIFSSDKTGVDNLYRKRADGSGETERLTESEGSQWACSWSRDGKIALTGTAKGAGFDVFVMSMSGEHKPETFLGTPFREGNPAFSPDGRWLAYDSNESGRLEVYVRPFPAGGGRWQVSDGGGGFPRWSRDGRELFYRTDTGIMSAAVEAVGDTLRVGKPHSVLTGAFRGGSAGIGVGGLAFADYDVSSDGQRFVMFPAPAGAGQAEHQHVTLVTHWFEDLARVVPPGRN
jgi:serine/threonine protein kinase/Tol biopolymer transport system component